MSVHLPPGHPGQVIGLLGGSFDPPHRGHLHISHEALKRFGLDRLWWVMSPGNPLKRHGPAPLARRMAAAAALIAHPRIHLTDVEAQIGSRHTAQTLTELRRIRPGLRFVWLMGADNLAQLHRWQNWHDIVAQVPLGVLARPGQRISARLSVAARIYPRARLSARESHLLGRASPPAWCFVNVPMVALSSTGLRAGGDWRAHTPK